MENQEKRSQGKMALVIQLFLGLRPMYRRGQSRLVPGSTDPSREDSGCKGAEEKSTGSGDPCAGSRADGTRNMLPGVRETWQVAGIDCDQVPHGTMSI